MFANDKLIVC